MSCCGRWWKQAGILLFKNGIISWRNKRATFLQLLAPILLVLALWLIEWAIVANSSDTSFSSNKNPKEKAIADIPLCIRGDGARPCATFDYVPCSHPLIDIDAIITEIRLTNNPPIPGLNQTRGVRCWASEQELDDYLIQKKNGNTTNGAILFRPWNYSLDAYINVTDPADSPFVMYSFPPPPSGNASANSTSAPAIPPCDASTPPDRCVQVLSYALEFNESANIAEEYPVNRWTYFQVPLQLAVERALLRYQTRTLGRNQTTPRLVLNVTRYDYPHPQTYFVNVIGFGGPLFFFGALMFNLVVALGQLVGEKQSGMRESLRLAGMYMSTNWLSWLITFVINNTITVFLIIIMGSILRFDFFLKNNFLLYFLLLELFALSLVSMSVLLSSFLQNAQRAVALGFIFFLIGSLFTFVGVTLFEQSNVIVALILSLFSPALLAKGLSDLGDAANNGGGIALSDACTYTDNWNLCVIYFFLAFDTVLYLVLGLYLDAVLPRAIGRRLHPFFCFFPSFWTGKPRRNKLKAPVTADEHKQAEGQDDDVYHEELDVLRGRYDDAAIVVMGLARKFTEWENCYTRRKVNQAVHPLFFHINDGELFCLLGPNGAGKSTAISMLTTMQSASAGDASMFGYSISTDSAAIGKQLGLCPQFDVLWPELSAREHLLIFSVLKGVSDVKKEIKTRLGEVGLGKSKNTPTSAFSGGMKRRLSVALAFCGDPRVVFLDEPGTGMDVVSRRHVWSAIQKQKKGRAIILTTHSMEEADVLGDNIAILKKGKLQCFGTPVYLKAKYGAGTTITLRVSRSAADSVAAFIAKRLPETVTSHYKSGFLITEISSHCGSLRGLLKDLEDNSATLGITDLQVEMASLESVFLRIVGMENVDDATTAAATPPSRDGSSSDVSGKQKGASGSAPVARSDAADDHEEF